MQNKNSSNHINHQPLKLNYNLAWVILKYVRYRPSFPKKKSAESSAFFLIFLFSIYSSKCQLLHTKHGRNISTIVLYIFYYCNITWQLLTPNPLGRPWSISGFEPFLKSFWTLFEVFFIYFLSLAISRDIFCIFKCLDIW